ncbi:MAG: hypothetical protein NUW22_09180 [Acidobacteria bacterium]|nr:hypothetical protein [Acidobacteriota bacterium]
MSKVWTAIVSVATLVVMGGSPMATPVAQEQGRAGERTEKGLYLLKVVEPGYDVTVREIERAATFSVLEMGGVVPTMTAGGVILFRAVYEIARERKFEYTFSLPPGQGQPAGATSTWSGGRRIAVVTKVFMTNDAKTSLKELLGADYTEEAQKLFNLRGYQSVAQLAKMFGGRGM